MKQVLLGFLIHAFIASVITGTVLPSAPEPKINWSNDNLMVSKPVTTAEGNQETFYCQLHDVDQTIQVRQ